MRLTAVAVVVLSFAGGHMPKIKRTRTQSYGKGVAALIQTNTLPTAYNLAIQAASDADKWWASQGTRPQPLNLQVAAPPEGETMGYGYYNSGTVDLAPQYLQHVNQTLTDSATRRGRVEALVGLWRLLAHERGHNLGYGHTPGGIMDATWASPPGEAYTWARQMMRNIR